MDHVKVAAPTGAHPQPLGVQSPPALDLVAQVTSRAEAAAASLRRFVASPADDRPFKRGDAQVRDHLLVARVAAGDDDAIGEIFDRHGAFVLGVARRVTASTSVAEEVLQEVFLALWRNPEGFDLDRGSLRAYLGVQAHRRAVGALPSDTQAPCELFEPAESYTSDEMDSATLTEVVRQAIARLPDDQRDAVELAFWQGHTQREVADILGIPPDVATSRLRLARTKLSEWLAPLAMETV